MRFVRQLLASCVVLCVLLVVTPVALAAPVLFQANGLATLGPHAVVALDFIDGDGTSNHVATFNFSTDGSLLLQSQTGGVTGNTGDTITLQDGSFFNEALLLLNQANTISFQFNASTVAPLDDGFADAFSVFLLDADTELPLIETDDPTGANALMLFVIDGSDSGQLKVYTQVSSLELGWNATPMAMNGVPTPSSLWLVLGALAALSLVQMARDRLCSVAAATRVGLWLALACGINAASAADLTAEVQISRSGFVLNRSSNTFDTQVTVTNKSIDTLLGPLWLVLDGATPTNVALYNSFGKTATGADYLVLPLTAGVLSPGASTTGVIKLINTGQSVTQAAFSVQGGRMSTGTSLQLNISASIAAGPNADQAGAPVGAGWVVRVDGVARGATDAAGKLSVQVPVGASTVSVERAPSWAGSTALPPLTAGQARTVQVLVEDGKEIPGDGLLRFDQVQQLLLPRNIPRISLRFLKDEQPIRLASLNWATVSDNSGNQVNLSSLFSVQADGTVTAVPAAFFQALADKGGKLTLNIDGNDAGGQVFDGSAVFYIADYRVRVQLVAPPSNPGLAVGGVKLSGNMLNTDVHFNAQSDANGYIVLPDLPAGNLNLNASTTANGIVFAGIGTLAVNQHLLVNLTLRGPQDVINNVPPITVFPLPQDALLQPSLRGLPAPAGGKRPPFTPAQRRARTQLAERLAARQGYSPVPQRATAVSGATQVSVSVTAGAQDEMVQSTEELTIKKGSKKVTLKYKVFTHEYPFFVLQQSGYNDVWAVTVLGSNGGLLFDITRQINAQVTQEPVWQDDGTTAEIKQEIDVAALTATSDTTLILRAYAMNIGTMSYPPA